MIVDLHKQAAKKDDPSLLAFDACKVDVSIVPEGVEFYGRFHFIPKTTRDALHLLSNVGFKDAAHCEGTARGTSLREDVKDANDQVWSRGLCCCALLYVHLPL